LSDDFKVKGSRRQLGESRLSPRPFAKGGMRFASYLHTQTGMFALKAYNRETLNHIKEGLHITEEQAIMKEVSTYLVADYFAQTFNESLPGEWNNRSNHVRFLKPYVFRLRDSAGQVHTWFAEEYVEGEFIKWNSNAGYVNSEFRATEHLMDKFVDTFSHHTWHASKGNLIVVDIQGWNLGDHTSRNIVFTDPQIHTKSFSGGNRRTSDKLYQRFSLGNLGRTGMLRFFQNHKCSQYCAGMNMKAVGMREFKNGPSFTMARGSVLHATQVPLQAEGSVDALLERRLVPINIQSQSNIIDFDTAIAVLVIGILVAALGGPICYVSIGIIVLWIFWIGTPSHGDIQGIDRKGAN